MQRILGVYLPVRTSQPHGIFTVINWRKLYMYKNFGRNSVAETSACIENCKNCKQREGYFRRSNSL